MFQNLFQQILYLLLQQICFKYNRQGHLWIPPSCCWDFISITQRKYRLLDSEVKRSFNFFLLFVFISRHCILSLWKGPAEARK